jgi:hypothetical protein
VVHAPADVELNPVDKGWLTQEAISQIWQGNFFTLLSFEQKLKMEDEFTWLSCVKALLNSHDL